MLYLFQFGEVHAEAFFAEFTTELDFDEFGGFLHLTFEDNTFAKFVVSHAITWLELLSFWAGRRRDRRG